MSYKSHCTSIFRIHSFSERHELRTPLKYPYKYSLRKTSEVKLGRPSVFKTFGWKPIFSRSIMLTNESINRTGLSWLIVSSKLCIRSWCREIPWMCYMVKYTKQMLFLPGFYYIWGKDYFVYSLSIGCDVFSQFDIISQV